MSKVNDVKTIRYFVRAFFFDGELMVASWKTAGHRWRAIGSAPGELRELLDSGKAQFENFGKCRKGKFFCGSVTVSRTITRVGLYYRRKRANEK